MQTPPISNLPGNQSVAASPSRYPEANTLALNFNQVLSSQLSEKPVPSNPDKPVATNKPKEQANSVEKQKTPDPQKSNSANSANACEESGKTADSKEAVETDSNTASTAPINKPMNGKSSVVNSKGESKEKEKKLTDIISTDNDTLTAASAQMLALVANVNQVQVQTPTSDSSNNTEKTMNNAIALDTKTLGANEMTVKTAIDEMTLNEDAGTAKKGKRDVESTSFKSTANVAASALLQQPDENKQLIDIQEIKLQGNSSEILTPQALQQLENVASKQQDLLTDQSTLASLPVQQGAFELTKAVTSQPLDKLTPAVGTAAWDQALGQKVVWMVAGTQQSASLTLNPPDLGPLQVVLNVSNGQTDAAFTAAQPEVRQALEAALPKLRDMMNEAGIQLGQATIGAGMPNQYNSPNDQGQSPERRFNKETTQIDSVKQIQVPAAQLTKEGLVNTFA